MSGPSPGLAARYIPTHIDGLAGSSVLASGIGTREPWIAKGQPREMTWGRRKRRRDISFRTITCRAARCTCRTACRAALHCVNEGVPRLERNGAAASERARGDAEKPRVTHGGILRACTPKVALRVDGSSDAREAVATLTGKDARDVLFTSGGTEANNLAITSAMQRPGKLLVSRIEHPSVTRVAERYEADGRVRWLRVAQSGAVDLEDLRAALFDEVSMLAICAISAEMGILQPLDTAIGLAQARGVWVHVDAVQAFGRVQSASTLAQAADTVSLAGHKLRGPKGIGALARHCRARVSFRSSSVARKSAGFVRAPSTQSRARVCLRPSRARTRAPKPTRGSRALRDRLERALLEMGAERNGDPALRAPHIASLAFPNFLGPELVAALNLEGVAVSAGPACSAGTMEPSKSLTMLYGEDRARHTIRISLGEEDDSRRGGFRPRRFSRSTSTIAANLKRVLNLRAASAREWNAFAPGWIHDASIPLNGKRAARAVHARSGSRRCSDLNF